MKAALITSPGVAPAYTDFKEPEAAQGAQVLTVTAAALSHLTRGRASGTHYSAENSFPFVPGVDGVGRTADGKRWYFMLPEAPFGAFAEQTLARPERCLPLPDDLDDITAAALANPGMSAWAALCERARFQPGETVLINGATGIAGRTAVQVARHLGARRILVSGRNAAELEQLRSVGASVVLPFSLDGKDPQRERAFEDALLSEFAKGIDVVLDYLWGASANIIITAIAKAVEDAHPVRFVHVGAAAGENTIALPGAALRSSAIQLMGSGLKSVSMAKLQESIAHVFAIAHDAELSIETQAVPLSQIAEYWGAPGRPRIVFTF